MTREEIIAGNIAAGGMFSPDFNDPTDDDRPLLHKRLYEGLHGTFAVLSRTQQATARRRYTVAQVNPDYSLDLVGGYDRYASAKGAHRATRNHAATGHPL